jgi:hypothetical protein
MKTFIAIPEQLANAILGLLGEIPAKQSRGVLNAIENEAIRINEEQLQSLFPAVDAEEVEFVGEEKEAK